MYRDNTIKESQAVKESTQKEKGVDTMKKNCYRRKDGRWQYSKQEDGFLYYAIANTYRELIEKIKQIKPRQIKQTKQTKTKTLTFLQYFKSFIDTYINTKNIKDHTKYIWKNFADHYIAPNFQRVQIDKLTTEQLQEFINGIEKERTRDMIYQAVVRVIKKAVVTGVIKKDISLGLEKQKRLSVKERSPLTIDEQTKLLDKAKSTKIYAFVMFSLIIGSRREETLSFCLRDINEEKKQIHIKGTKTKNADRYVNVTPEFITFLREHLPKGVFDIKKDYATKALSKMFKDLQINNCLHGLRHTCSANLYFLGANDKYRQMQLGHSSIVITNDIYTNIKENIEKSRLLELYGDFYPKFD